MGVSVIRDHILADGGMDFAPRAVAAAVFELAQGGYLKIRLPSSRLETIRLTKTAKPGDKLLPEQRILLQAIFGPDRKNGDRTYLKQPHKTPISQSLAAYARALLVMDGSVRKLRPRKVYRWLCIIFYGSLTVGSLVLISLLWQIETIFIALIISSFLWAIFSGFTMDLKKKRVFRKPKSAERYKMLDTLRSSCRYNMYPSSIPVAASNLPYELLWLRHGEPRSVTKGLYDKKPTWCDNQKWFDSHAKITQSLITATETLLWSLGGQGSIKEYVSLPEGEGPISAAELADKKLELLIDIEDNLREVMNLTNDLSDWGAGGDGSGGDGGDGSGGDGGGDSGGDG